MHAWSNMHGVCGPTGVWVAGGCLVYVCSCITCHRVGLFMLWWGLRIRTCVDGVYRPTRYVDQRTDQAFSDAESIYASPSKYPTAAKHCALVVYATDSQLTEQTARPQLVTKTETPLTLITQSSLSTLSKLTMETDGHDLLLGE